MAMRAARPGMKEAELAGIVEGIAIACGNYFDFSAAPFDALYDRAAFSALPPGKRPEYAQMTGELLKPGAARLLVTLEFDDSLVEGPPYPAWRDEVSALWPGLERVEARDDTPNAPPKFLEAGLDLIRSGALIRLIDKTAARGDQSLATAFDPIFETY